MVFFRRAESLGAVQRDLAEISRDGPGRIAIYGGKEKKGRSGL